ncbi:MAG: BCCT family transporter [Propionibacteriales bacterium]|nr:BCCT family transporter [Propionibacteriales bacterium]
MSSSSQTDTGTQGGSVQRALSTVHGPVFYPAAIIVLAFVIFAMVAPDTAYNWLLEVQNQVVSKLGWYYVLIVSGFIVFALWVGLGHFGDIKLGPDDEEPEYSVGAWFSMLFAAGMGIGLVFFGVAEPLFHFVSNSGAETAGVLGGDPGSRAQGSLVMSFLHWGLHPWAIYVVVGLAVAYSVHRKGRPVSIRWALEPLLGDRVKGWIGDVIDIAAIVGTLFGVATSLGLGVSQIAAGLSFLDLLSDPGTASKVVLIGLITTIAVISVVTGIDKGIKWLSQFNMGLAGALLVFVAFAGPILFIFRDVVQSLGLYLQNIIQLSFNTSAMSGDAGVAWQGGWTIFYWGWWISWAPFVGVFIARISRGRTVRQFVAGVMLVPTSVTFLWFLVFGGSALSEQLQRGGEQAFAGGLIGEDGVVSQEASLFGLLDGLPIGTLLAAAAVILIAVFFITSSDSGSFVVDMLASGGDENPPVWSRVFWAVLEGAVAAALLIAGGDNALLALRYGAIIIALPFSIVMLAMCWATIQAFRSEREVALRIQRRLQREELTEHVSQSLIDEGLIEPNGEGAERPVATGAGGAPLRTDEPER